MREIKFRVWNKQYMEFDIFDVWNPYCLENGHFMKIEGPVGEEWTETTAAILMQYTGLQDKNSIDIYEGDIVIKGINMMQYNLPNEYQEIIFEKGCFVGKQQKAVGYLKFVLSAYLPSEIEIVGNIYENPELLKEINV